MKYLITQTLVSAWLWSYKTEGGYEDFLKTLNREKSPQNKAMLDGIHFENVVNSVLNGAEIKAEHEWFNVISELQTILDGSSQQVKLSRDIEVDGEQYVIYGIFDFLKCGVIYDTKYSKTYSVGKYLTSPQHPFYFYLCPEAIRFTYLISDGKYVYKETYYPEDVEPIDRIVKQFIGFLKNNNLLDTYHEKWESKY